MRGPYQVSEARSPNLARGKAFDPSCLVLPSLCWSLLITKMCCFLFPHQPGKKGKEGNAEDNLVGDFQGTDAKDDDK